MDANSLILTLLNLNGWGPKKVYDYVHKHSFDYIKCVDGLVNELSTELKNVFKIELSRSKETLKKNLEQGINAINILDPKFPKKLYNTNDKCVFLYYKGNIDLLNQKSIAIIGTRKPDEEFINKGEIVSKYFAKEGYVIVSGLALGCDTIAHSSCLEVNGKTVAVLPSSIDNIQPSSNKVLAKKILDNEGLLISEYGVGSPFSKYNYATRDRIQSLLSSVTLIIQASDNSGTMIATKKSLKDKEMVYAIEGNKLTLVNNYIDVNSTNDLNDIKTWII